MRKQKTHLRIRRFLELLKVIRVILWWILKIILLLLKKF